MPELTLREVASKGGKSTFQKYGPEYFRTLQSKRKVKRGKNSSKLPIDNE